MEFEINGVEGADKILNIHTPQRSEKSEATSSIVASL